MDRYDFIIILTTAILCFYIIITDRIEHGKHEYKRGMQNMSQALYDLKTMPTHTFNKATQKWEGIK